MISNLTETLTNGNSDEFFLLNEKQKYRTISDYVTESACYGVSISNHYAHLIETMTDVMRSIMENMKSPHGFLSQRLFIALFCLQVVSR